MSKSLFNNLRVVLLDRDGVINEEPGPILTPEQFVMIPKALLQLHVLMLRALGVSLLRIKLRLPEVI